MKEKKRGLLLNVFIYATAFTVAAVPFVLIDDMLAASAAFTAAATVAVFAASCVLSDVSVYDPYWSVAPPVIIAADMIKYRIFNANAAVLLLILLVWSVRLTANWVYTYKGVGHEDWRYATYREKYPLPLFLFISFTGLHFVPTIVVYAGLISAMLAIRTDAFSPFSLIGAAVMIGAVVLESISDNAIHRFLREHKEEKRTCDVSVWRYSRHPNYLGEMSFWCGLYLYYLALCPAQWYKGTGFLLIILLFLFVSIPMMEKHNMQRRKDYAEYRAKTSVLLILPNKRTKKED
ncbi:MAG: DUF1295 domain-containing protein [Clostridia bacterium]|nr:DUF1295 domain-containing protein [Clostridia bacterium]